MQETFVLSGTTTTWLDHSTSLSLTYDMATMCELQYHQLEELCVSTTLEKLHNAFAGDTWPLTYRRFLRTTQQVSMWPTCPWLTPLPMSLELKTWTMIEMPWHCSNFQGRHALNLMHGLHFFSDRSMSILGSARSLMRIVVKGICRLQALSLSQNREDQSLLLAKLFTFCMNYVKVGSYTQQLNKKKKAGSSMSIRGILTMNAFLTAHKWDQWDSVLIRGIGQTKLPKRGTIELILTLFWTFSLSGQFLEHHGLEAQLFLMYLLCNIHDQHGGAFTSTQLMQEKAQRPRGPLSQSLMTECPSPPFMKYLALKQGGWLRALLTAWSLMETLRSITMSYFLCVMGSAS